MMVRSYILPGNSFILLLLVLLSSSKSITAWFTLVLGPVLVISGWYFSYYTNQNKKLAIGLMIIGAIATVLGMFFAYFQAPFRIGIPFGYYLMVSIFISIQFYISFDNLYDYIKSDGNSS